ncbi:hypothetical protein RRG08_019180 [Elysia crispata]|uniref:Uncharacterized protein n=1 Tax=Elysia crispata TaxID=231223 RepID=A0AAE0ZWI6_9GAST|nr:hypothetical protein RRG08_019180 [Elysia crispata]
MACEEKTKQLCGASLFLTHQEIRSFSGKFGTIIEKHFHRLAANRTSGKLDRRDRTHYDFSTSVAVDDIDCQSWTDNFIPPPEDPNLPVLSSPASRMAGGKEDGKVFFF